jgi:hypothetical protein
MRDIRPPVNRHLADFTHLISSSSSNYHGTIRIRPRVSDLVTQGFLLLLERKGVSLLVSCVKGGVVGGGYVYTCSNEASRLAH